MIRVLPLTCRAALLLSMLVMECQSAESPPRIPPPTTWPRDVLDTFFDDAREQLVGTRPAVNSAMVTTSEVPGDTATSDAEKFRWSALIDADTLTAEIRRLNNQLAPLLKQSATFQGGGNLACRRDFGYASVLFGVLADFDQDARWQSSAAYFQDRAFLAGENCKAASAQSLAAAKAMQAMLDALVRGQPPEGEVPPDRADAPRLVDRALLMQSMEQLLKKRLAPALSNERDFRRQSQQAAEQGQLLAVLAEVIQREGYEYTDDDTYLHEAQQLSTAARELATAGREKNYEAARAAAGKVTQSCSRCHEDFRG